MADAPETIPGGFAVDLKLLGDTIDAVTREKTAVAASLEAIGKETKGLATSWNSPAHGTFEDVRIWFETASTDVMGLLDEILLRLKVSRDNYANAENANASNVTV